MNTIAALVLLVAFSGPDISETRDNQWENFVAGGIVVEMGDYLIVYPIKSTSRVDRCLMGVYVYGNDWAVCVDKLQHLLADPILFRAKTTTEWVSFDYWDGTIDEYPRYDFGGNE